MRGEIKRKRKYLKTQEDPSDIMHGGGSVFAYAYNRVEIWDTSVLNHIKIQNCETQCKYKSSKKQKQNWYNFTPDVKKCMGLWDYGTIVFHFTSSKVVSGSLTNEQHPSFFIKAYSIP